MPSSFMVRCVFGVTLQESMAVAQIANLPAVVFRCIQYLETKKADQEEGIYRLSGSSMVIKNLKDRFNTGKGRSFVKHVRLTNTFSQRATWTCWAMMNTGTCMQSPVY